MRKKHSQTHYLKLFHNTIFWLLSTKQNQP